MLVLWGCLELFVVLTVLFVFVVICRFAVCCGWLWFCCSSWGDCVLIVLHWFVTPLFLWIVHFGVCTLIGLLLCFDLRVGCFSCLCCCLLVTFRLVACFNLWCFIMFCWVYVSWLLIGLLWWSFADTALTTGMDLVCLVYFGWICDVVVCCCCASSFVCDVGFARLCCLID